MYAYVYLEHLFSFNPQYLHSTTYFGFSVTRIPFLRIKEEGFEEATIEGLNSDFCESVVSLRCIRFICVKRSSTGFNSPLLDIRKKTYSGTYEIPSFLKSVKKP